MKSPVNWTWSRKKEAAAKLLAEGGVTAKAIAEHLGVARETLRFWKRSPEFNERIEQHLDRCRAELARQQLASIRRIMR
jgi:transposase-like protein